MEKKAYTLVQIFESCDYIERNEHMVIDDEWTTNQGSQYSKPYPLL